MLLQPKSQLLRPNLERNLFSFSKAKKKQTQVWEASQGRQEGGEEAHTQERLLPMLDCAKESRVVKLRVTTKKQ